MACAQPEPTLAEFRARCVSYGMAADSPGMPDCVQRVVLAYKQRRATREAAPSTYTPPQVHVPTPLPLPVPLNIPPTPYSDARAERLEAALVADRLDEALAAERLEATLAALAALRWPFLVRMLEALRRRCGGDGAGREDFRRPGHEPGAGPSFFLAARLAARVAAAFRAASRRASGPIVATAFKAACASLPRPWSPRP